MTDRERPLILAVDDDERVRTLCVAALSGEFEVVTAENGKQALAAVYQRRPDAVLLDVTMPVLDGWETCRRIRDLADVPVIMLTAHGADRDVVRGLDAGADDYVTKPFRPLQLAARIRAVLRRKRRGAGAAGGADGEEAEERLSFDNGALVVDTARRVAVVRGREVALSATEYRLLETLARHAGRVLSHDQILEHVWGHAYAGETGYVKTYVGLLRTKVEDDPKRPKWILARRGLGYYLERSFREPEAVAAESSAAPLAAAVA